MSRSEFSRPNFEEPKSTIPKKPVSEVSKNPAFVIPEEKVSQVMVERAKI